VLHPYLLQANPCDMYVTDIDNQKRELAKNDVSAAEE
jgi:hypothetical protein